MRMKFCGNCGKKIPEGTVCDCKKEKRRIYEQATKDRPKDLTLSTYRWKKKREKIKKRDGYICQRCFLKFNIIVKDDLEVHHIKSRKNYPELAFDDSNLICICGVCNKQLGTKDKLDFEWEYRKDRDNL